MPISLSDIEKLEVLSRSVQNAPSHEEAMNKIAERAETNPTAFHNWFPTVEEQGILAPKSISVDFPLSLIGFIDDGDREGFNKAVQPVVDAIRKAGDELGWPLFIKNSLFSAKHDWDDTCYFKEGMSDAHMAHQLGHLYFNWEMITFGQNPAKELIVREFIETNTQFIAFDGHMPITREFRLFTDDAGQTVGYQAYWPELAFHKRDGSLHVDEAKYPNWREMLNDIAQIDDDTLSHLSLIASQVTQALNDKFGRQTGMSVDFLHGRDGRWYLIDMATAVSSYKDKVGYKTFGEPISYQDNEGLEVQATRIIRGNRLTLESEPESSVSPR